MALLALSSGCEDSGDEPHAPPPSGAAGVGGASACPSDTEVVEHDDEVVDAPARWSGRHHVLRALEIRAELSLDPCSVVAFDTNAFAVVDGGGAILARGTAEAPVTFTSGVLPPGRGDWAGIEIRGDTAPSVFESVIVEYAGSVYFFFGQSSLRFDDGANVSLSSVLVRKNGEAQCAIGVEKTARLERFDDVETRDSPQGLCLAADAVGPISDVGSFTSDVPIAVTSTTLTQSGTWRDFGQPYRLSGPLAVRAELTLGEGVALEVPTNGNVVVSQGGALVAAGSATRHVRIDGIDAGAPGAWQNVAIDATALATSSFTFTDFEHGGGKEGYGSLYVSGARVTLDHAIFSDSAGCDVKLEGDAELTSADGTSDFTTCP